MSVLARYYSDRFNLKSLSIKNILSVTLILISMNSLVGCKGAGTGFADSQDAMSVCPPGGCSNLAPDQTQLSLSYRGKSTIYQTPVIVSGQPVDSIEIGGECYPSSYANNRVEYEIYMGSSNRLALGTTDVTSSISGQTTPRCKNGRFGLTINGNRLPSGAVYRVDLAIIGIDAQSNEFRNDGSGRVSVSISR